MNKAILNLTVVSATALLSAVAPAFADCSGVGKNSINDALVANLEQQAAAAEAQAATARTPGERARWEATARSIERQAQAAQSRQQALGDAAESLCNTITNSGSETTSDDDDN